MVYDENIAKMIWAFIFATILMVCSCLLLRFVLSLLLEMNVCNLQNIFSNTRFLQTREERKICNSLAKSLKWTFQDSNIQRMVPIQPQFMAANIPGSHRGDSSALNHWPLFQIAVDGKILDPELLIATRSPEYHTVVENATVESTTTNSNTMLTTDYFRNNIQPLGVNTSLNRHDDSRNSGYGSGFGGFSGSQDHVPVDRPLFVNTSMSAQQRVDLYRRLSDPPRDNEPALAFSYGRF